MFYKSFLLLWCFSTCLAKNRLVSLQAGQESVVLCANKLADYPLIVIDSKCQKQTCKVEIVFEITDPANTTFSLFSSNGYYEYSKDDLSFSRILDAPISMLINTNSSKNFVVSFRMYEQNEYDWLNTTLIGLSDDDSGFITLNDSQRTVTLALKRHDHPILKILTPKISASCILQFYAGGIPNRDSRDNKTHLLFQYDGSAFFQSSYLKNDAVTIWIDDECEASFIYHVTNTSFVPSGDFKPSTGLLMSYEWEDPFGDSMNYDDSQSVYLYGQENEPRRTIYLNVQADPAGGSLLLRTTSMYGSIYWQQNITQYTNQIFKASGQQLQILWNPGYTGVSRGYSVDYWILDDAQSSTTRIPSNSSTTKNPVSSSSSSGPSIATVSIPTTIPLSTTTATSVTVVITTKTTEKTKISSTQSVPISTRTLPSQVTSQQTSLSNSTLPTYFSPTTQHVTQTTKDNSAVNATSLLLWPFALYFLKRDVFVTI